MLSVATANSALPFPNDMDVDAALLLDASDDGATSAEHSRDASSSNFSRELENDDATTTTVATAKRFVQTTTTTNTGKAEDDDDSDYRSDEEESASDDDDDDDSESEDDEAHMASLESQLDEHADEVDDYYLQQMLAQRDALEDDEAAWVDSYIERQRQWKETHGTSIDEMDLDLLRVPPHRRTSSKKQKTKATETAWSSSGAIAEAWHGRVSPRLLSPPLREQSRDMVLSLVGVALFVGIALAVQFYVAFQAPPMDS